MRKKIQLLKWAVPLLVLLVVVVAAFSGNLHATKADSSQGSCQLTWNSEITLNPGNAPQDVQTALSGAHLTNCTQPHTSCTLVQGSGDTTLNFDNIRASSPTLVSNLEADNINLNCNGVPINERFSSTSTQCDNTGSTLSDSACDSNTPDPSPGSCQLAWINGGGGSVTLDASQVTDQGLQTTLGDYNLKCAADVSASSCTLIPGEGNEDGDTILDLANVQNRSSWIYQQLVDQYGLNCDDGQNS